MSHPVSEERCCPSGWGLDARLTTLLCKNKKILLRNPKKWKADGPIQAKSDRIFYGSLWLKKGCFANDNDGSRIKSFDGVEEITVRVI
jgi:hypothetical protein